MQGGRNMILFSGSGDNPSISILNKLKTIEGNLHTTSVKGITEVKMGNKCMDNPV